jgi:hypothetical protein
MHFKGLWRRLTRGAPSSPGARALIVVGDRFTSATCESGPVARLDLRHRRKKREVRGEPPFGNVVDRDDPDRARAGPAKTVERIRIVEALGRVDEVDGVAGRAHGGCARAGRLAHRKRDGAAVRVSQFSRARQRSNHVAQGCWRRRRRSE